MLDEAIVDLETESPVTPSSDDLIFQGDIQAWKSAAYALKARYYLHTTKRSSGAAINSLLALQNAGVENFAYYYSGTNTDSNPINDFFTSTSYAVVDPQFIGIMGISDPRFEYFVDIIPFSGGLSKVGDFKASITSPVFFMSREEQYFIEAEAHLIIGNLESSQEALRNGVQYSLDRVELELGVEIEDNDELELVNSLVLSGDFESNLEIIMQQKFIALQTENEPWVDYRRTGYPLLEPNENGFSNANPNGEIPRRVNYPQSERTLNPNTPTGLNMQSRTWWDE
jgi:hypothetical protein